MTKLFDLTGKTAVAIGGNSVLGSSICKGFAEHGAKVAIVGRNLEKAEAVVKEIEAAGSDYQKAQQAMDDHAKESEVLDLLLERWAELSELVND
ncbi:SDR family NAD(P)-dependent oxidoreductase [Aeromonas veronii]|nr:SDR family NAD(P)-dependent oxidoreductase [Aeromonas veronii]